MGMLLIDTTTSLTAQRNNFYPIDQNTVDFKFSVSPSITGYEWRLYQVDALGSLEGAIELAGQETASADNQTYVYTHSVDIPVALQIISQPNNDYIESTTFYTLTADNKDISITLIKDINN